MTTFRKSLASLAIAGSILASTGAMASANSEKHEFGDMHTNSEVRQNVDTACMSTAIDTRDTAVIAALDAYYSSVKASLTARKAALKAAWLLTDQKARHDALKAAWTTFHGTWKKSTKDLKVARRAAWDAFNTTSKKTCHGQSENRENSSIDMKL